MTKPHKIYATDLDGKTYAQFMSALSQEYSIQGALMPDAHLGYAMPIGGVIATQGVIVPAWIGYDIGCSMNTQRIAMNAQVIRDNADAIFDEIYAQIPVGKTSRAQEMRIHDNGSMLDDLIGGISPLCLAEYRVSGGYQLGTLGSGNHFLEVGFSDENTVWITVHSGSRHLGHRVATYWMDQARSEGVGEGEHKGLNVNSDLGQLYYNDMNFCLWYALYNRRAMLNIIGQVIRKYAPAASFFPGTFLSVHNIATMGLGRTVIHRKGATEAHKNEAVIIPGNMRDGVFLGRGLGNPDSLESCSHGAGRTKSRAAAKSSLDMAEFEQSMVGVKAKVSLGTLDESPAAYKDIFTVLENQKDLVEIHTHIRPLINIKA